MRVGLMMMAGLAGGLVWAVAGCGGSSQKCTPNHSVTCVVDEANPDGAIYWVDSCGEREGISKVCQCGCNADVSGCEQCVCEPECEGAVCGSDGCGGTCPPGCAAHEDCNAEGQCVACEPDCGGRACGSDGCGGTCPPGCAQGEGCDLDGQCVPCTPACDNKDCGPDGCGGSCGDCPDGQVCSGAGLCEDCRPECAGKVCGSDGCGGSCGTCSDGQVCTPTGECFSCTPECGQRVCGSDTCGGNCGTCPDGLACDQDGACQEVSCNGQPSTLSGSLRTAATNPAFDSATVGLAHRRDLDPATDGCLTDIAVELSLAGGCRLTVAASTRYLAGQGLEIRQVAFEADGQCPGLDPGDVGTYGGRAGLTTAHITPSLLEVPDPNAYSSCLALGLVIELEGELNRQSDGAGLAVLPTRIEIFAEVTSMGNPLAACPCWSDCRNKACGDDGCGFDCGICPGATSFCDAGYQCVDDCEGRDCGPSPVMGYQCGQCPGFFEECLDGACSCPNTICLGECCAPDAICAQGACCLPDCNGRQCGDDGCGGSCGTCNGGLNCIDGLCMGDLDWVLIEGGTFMMGSPPQGVWPNEEPEHEVTLPSFELLRTEVTVAQYAECVAAGVCDLAGGAYRCTQSEQVNLPINCVMAAKADQFCGWLDARLPSEAEWEYAARSRGQLNIFPWGVELPTCEYAIWDQAGENGLSGCGTAMPWPVCSRPMGNTEQGLCDMGGNVAEIVADNLHGSYDGAPVDGSAWTDPEPPDAPRIARGGHFNDRDGEDLRTRARKPFSYYWQEPFFGFRCARDVE